MINTELLNEHIQLSGLKKKFLAEKLGLSVAGFSNCLTNKAEFKLSQMHTLCELLSIEDMAAKEAIFFADFGG